LGQKDADATKLEDRFVRAVDVQRAFLRCSAANGGFEPFVAIAATSLNDR